MNPETITPETCLADLEALMRDIPLAIRRKHSGGIARIARMCSIEDDACKHLTRRVSDWPVAVNREHELRYYVDFGHGENPDHDKYLATEFELRELLNYTRASFKVAMSTNQGMIDRTKHVTRLGPCVVYRLDPDVISTFAHYKRLGDRAARVAPVNRFKVRPKSA